MTFLQTKGGQLLINHLANYATKNRFCKNNQEIEKMLQGHIKMHGLANVKQACRKANQKAKIKFYEI